MIQGGQTRNAIQDQCTFAVDFRIPVGMDRQQSVNERFAALETLEIHLTHCPLQCFVLSLETPPDDSFVGTSLEICRDVLRHGFTPLGMPCSTDACWIPKGVPAIVLGPGELATDHAVDECLQLYQVLSCAAIYQRLMLRDWSNA